MRILVTGGCGVIGSWFVRSMLARGHAVIVADHCEEPRNLYLKRIVESEGAVVWTGRIENWSQYGSQTLSRLDLVLHAAAFTGIPSSAENPHDDWVSNVDATRVLLEGLRLAEKKPKLVVLSSVKPYNLRGLDYRELATRYEPIWTADPISVDENFPLSPDEPYAASKMAQSAICQAYARSYNLPITIFRCSNLYGPAPSHGPRHGWLTWFCISAAIGRPLIVQGNGKQTRDMLHASDVESAVMAAYDNWDHCQGELFNLGGGPQNTISVIEAAAQLRELSGCEIQSAPGRQHEDPIFVTNYGKFARATGWRPCVSVNSGLQRIYEWAVEHRDALKPLYEGL